MAPEDASRRVFFREEALRHYQQGHEQMVLPRFISPPIIGVLWCFVVLLFVGSVIAWFWHVPIYVMASGEVSQEQGQQETLVVLILSGDQSSEIHTGLSVLLQVGQNGPQWQQHISSVSSTLLSPTEIRDRFNLDDAGSLLVQQPSAVALIRVPADASYNGSIVQARIQIGTRRVISLLPGLSGLGEG